MDQRIVAQAVEKIPGRVLGYDDPDDDVPEALQGQDEGAGEDEAEGGFVRVD